MLAHLVDAPSIRTRSAAVPCHFRERPSQVFIARHLLHRHRRQGPPGVFPTSAPHTGQRVRVGPSLRRERPLAGCRLSRETDPVGLPVHWPWSPSLPARGERLGPPFDGLPVLRDHPTPLVSSPSRLSFLDGYRLRGGSREVSSGKNTELRTDAVAYTPACPTDMGFAAVGQLTRRLGRLRGASLSLGSVLHR